jgi:hypothetical protein
MFDYIFNLFQLINWLSLVCHILLATIHRSKCAIMMYPFPVTFYHIGQFSCYVLWYKRIRFDNVYVHINQNWLCQKCVPPFPDLNFMHCLLFWSCHQLDILKDPLWSTRLLYYTFSQFDKNAFAKCLDVWNAGQYMQKFVYHFTRLLSSQMHFHGTVVVYSDSHSLTHES